MAAVAMDPATDRLLLLLFLLLDLLSRVPVSSPLSSLVGYRMAGYGET